MLDVLTLYTVAFVVILIVTTAFVLEVASRGSSPVDLIWTLAFAGAIGTALFYLGATWSDGLWWFNALGNAASVITTFAMWNGVRADGGRRPLLWVTGVAAALTALAALLPGPEGGDWAGGWAVLIGTAVGAALGGVAGLRGRLRHHRLGGLLSGVLLVVAAYYTLRTVIYFAAGAHSTAFTRYVGTAPTVIVVLSLVLVASYAMVAIRTNEANAQRAARYAFDASTGLRTPVSFEPRAHDLLRDAERSGQPVALVTVALEGTEHLRTAFRRDTPDEALTLIVDNARLLAPPGASLAGRPSAGQDTFEVLLRGYTETQAHAWAETLRRKVIATPLEVEDGRLRLRVSLGVGSDAASGYDLDELRTTAAHRLEKALSTGGNRVQSWY